MAETKHSMQQVNIAPSLHYNSFDKSGIYDESYLKLRNDWLFDGNRYSQMQKKITHAFFHDSEMWEDRRGKNLDFLQYLHIDNLQNAVLENLRDLGTAIAFVSFFADCDFLYRYAAMIKKYFCKKLNIGSRNIFIFNNRRRNNQNNQDDEEDWHDALSDLPPPTYQQVTEL